MTDIKLVVFDLDGVITETSHQHYLAWKELADELGIEIDLKFNETLKGVSRMDSLDRILGRGAERDAGVGYGASEDSPPMMPRLAP